MEILTSIAKRDHKRKSRSFKHKQHALSPHPSSAPYSDSSSTPYSPAYQKAQPLALIALIIISHNSNKRQRKQQHADTRSSPRRSPPHPKNTARRIRIIPLPSFPRPMQPHPQLMIPLLHIRQFPFQILQSPLVFSDLLEAMKNRILSGWFL